MPARTKRIPVKGAGLLLPCMRERAEPISHTPSEHDTNQMQTTRTHLLSESTFPRRNSCTEWCLR